MIKINKQKASKIILVIFVAIVSLVLGALINGLFLKLAAGLNPIEDINVSKVTLMRLFFGDKCLLTYVIALLSTATLTYMLFYQKSVTAPKSDMQKITEYIEIPVASGQMQHGSAHFSTPAEQDKMFPTEKISLSNPTIKALYKAGEADYDDIENGALGEHNPLPINDKIFKSTGIPVKYQKIGNDEFVSQVTGDIHTLCIGTTRCGKTRTVVLQSVGMQALTGVDILCSDPKGEIYQYTYPFLSRLGYALFPIDFKNPSRSVYYNFLQLIIDAVNRNNISKAIQYCWDFVDGIVAPPGNSTDPLWSNGEKAILASAVMQVVYDNSPFGLKERFPDKSLGACEELYEREYCYYQNCTNLYNYIAEMAIENPQTEKLYLEDIIEVLPDKHPSKLILKMARSAPSKTRGSFITSALATLRLFTDPNIADMTSRTTDGFFDISLKKAIFMILPDSKETYYPLASLFVNQYYQYLADKADDKGGRLPRDFEFNLDEFGNFTKIPHFDGLMTVAAGRGIHFHLYIQSKEQLAKKYDKETAGIILDNCHVWIYLKSTGTETLDLISKKLDKYTVMSASASRSLQDNGSVMSINQSGSSSSSTQLMARSLLTPNELERLVRPDILVIVDGKPSMMQSPDLHQWYFNTMFGLGTPEHNIKLREIRENTRPMHEIEEIKLWNFTEVITELVTKHQMNSGFGGVSHERPYGGQTIPNGKQPIPMSYDEGIELADKLDSTF